MIRADIRLKGYATNSETISLLEEVGGEFDAAVSTGELTEELVAKYTDALERYERELSTSPWAQGPTNMFSALNDQPLNRLIEYALQQISVEFALISALTTITIKRSEAIE